MGHSLQPTNASSKNWINPFLQADSYSKPDSNFSLTSTIRYLPQTCIKNLTSKLWLSGSGPYLSAWTIEANSSVKLIKEFKIFTFERVKSVKVIKETENSKIFELVVVGGKSLKFIKLDFSSDDCNVTDLSLELQARDWILDLIQISSSQFNLLLTHNIILKLELSQSYIVIQEELIYSPVNCLLYSGKLINDELVIIGTIFNSVIIWNYKNTEVKFEKKYGKLECELKAHEGVIFNVDFTKDLSKLVSVSDDRSIRVWERNANSSSQYDYTLTHTIFGHTNRVWDAKFLPQNPLQLVSISEDSTLKYWELADNKKFEKLQSWKVSQGKNCWSFDLNKGGDQVVVGSNDSSVKLYQLKNLKKVENTSELCFTLELPKLSEYHDTIALPTQNEVENEEEVVVKRKPKRDFIRNLAPLSLFENIGISDLGYIFKFALVSSDNNWLPSAPQLISHHPELEHYCMVGALDYDELKYSPQIIALGTLTGKVILLKENSEAEDGFNTTKTTVTDQKVVSLKLTRYGKDGYLLLVYCINSYPKLYYIDNQFEVKLISELEVDNLHPMTINYSSELQHLAIGSRQGSLLVYSLADDLSSATLLQNIPNLHKKESLTSLRYAATNLITCGRDGAYTILTPSTNYSVQLYSKITKGWLENIQLINDSPLISYFFQKRLHCLNLNTNEEVFSIACGGGHREWYLMPEDENLVKGSVVYLRKEKIIIYPIGSNSEPSQNGGEFDLVLKGGLHGREIRTLTQTLNSDLLITGAEAGTLKLLQKSQNSLTSKLNLKAHSSVISKLLTFEFNSNKYLISAGGCEELKVWSINIGDLAMKEVFNSPIYSVDLEVRIMDLHYVESDGLLVVGYSDGYLRVFKFVDDNGSIGLRLVKATNFLDSCVLSIASVTNNNNLTILAIGTVSGKIGYFELYNLISSDASSEPFKVDKVHQNGVNCLTGQYTNSQIIFASGGEDNSIGIINIIQDESNSFNTKFELIKNCNDSAIQGIQFYDNFKLSSISLDQRLNLWSINVTSDSIKLELEYSKFSYVADPSDLQVLKSKDGKEGAEFGIVGIGLEVIELS